MGLAIGSQLGSNEITALLGKGGMGEVYRARDLKLKREVAIKILPDEFSRDPARVSRFQREAEVLASLNHPNIAAIYDLEESAGTKFLVLELVEGETLADLLQRGPLPVEEALNIAYQICEALEAAHDKGVIHRDLKPANVKITPEGKVKVLDFGLARAMSNAPANASLSNSPTLTINGTQTGVILGTAAYMSPEQAKGFNTDPRSDIFSFGAVLYEMFTGQMAFHGDTMSDVLASVLKTEPDLNLLPKDLNPRIHDLLRRALEKNPRRRWYAIGDLRVEMDTVLADPQRLFVEKQNAVTPRAQLWNHSIPVLLAIIVTAIITGTIMWYSRQSLPLAVTRLPLILGEGERFTGVRFGTQISISPDGTQIVYEANHQLYHRSLSELEARSIPGTQTTKQVLNPVFSPDGRSVAYVTTGSNGGACEVKKIALSGGVPTTICPCMQVSETSLRWSDDTILLGGSTGIMRVSQNGGKPETILAIKSGESAFGPQMLPGGQAVLFTLVKGQPYAGDQDNAQVVVQSLKSGGPQTLIDRASDARYVPTGHIVYASGGTLFAIAFDARTLKLTGEPVRVVEGIRRSLGAAVQYSFSNSGTLIYVPGPASTTTEQFVPAMMDGQGNVEPLKLPARTYAFPRMSPDGKRIAFEIDEGKQQNIWIYELGGTHTPRQLTVGGANHYPVWSADGARIAFQSDREGDLGIFWQRADGAGRAGRLTKPEQGVAHIPDSWSKDSDSLSFTAVKGSEAAIWILSLKDGKSTVFAQEASAFLARSAFSPDGRLVAYQSNETEENRLRLWVRPFPGTGAGYPIVAGGQPFWSHDGNELYYNSGSGGLISKVTITTRPAFAIGDPIPVAQGQFVNASSKRYPRNADSTPDGKLLGLVQAETTQSGSPSAPQIEVVLNWFEELRQRVPVK